MFVKVKDPYLKKYSTWSNLKFQNIVHLNQCVLLGVWERVVVWLALICKMFDKWSVKKVWMYFFMFKMLKTALAVDKTRLWKPWKYPNSYLNKLYTWHLSAVQDIIHFN